MTTLDLIEKYGIGYNCLSDAYALGMAHGLDGMEDAVRLAEEKARADAFEECINFIKDHSGEHYIDCDGCYGGELVTVFILDDWMCDVLEKLKEEKV